MVTLGRNLPGHLRYGSKEAFTRYVRGSLRRELIGCTYMQLKMPPTYLLLICLGPISTSLESILALLKLGCNQMQLGELPSGKKMWLAGQSLVNIL